MFLARGLVGWDVWPPLRSLTQGGSALMARSSIYALGIILISWKTSIFLETFLGKEWIGLFEGIFILWA